MDEKIALNFLNNYARDAFGLIKSRLQVETVLAKDIGEAPEDLISAASEFAIGKGLRGALITLGYNITGGKDYKAILETSIFLELFHLGILIQDDVMDSANMRRGHTTIHKLFEAYAKKKNIAGDSALYGESMAVCAGDALFYISFKVLLESGFDTDAILRAAKIYSDYSVRLVHGQVLDISSPLDGQRSEEEILKVLWVKSGEYTALLPLLIGMALGGGSNDVIKEDYVKNYATCLGWCFQIRDDYFSIYGDEKATGKPCGSDISEGKNSLFVNHFLKNATNEQVTEFRKYFGKKDLSIEEIAKVQDLFKAVGSYDYLLKKGQDYVKEGIAHIPYITNDAETAKLLESLLVLMIARTV